MEDCNACFCDENGKAACTYALCSNAEIKLKVRSKRSWVVTGEFGCTPDTHYRKDCNRCYCSRGRELCENNNCNSSKQTPQANDYENHDDHSNNSNNDDQQDYEDSSNRDYYY